MPRLIINSRIAIYNLQHSTQPYMYSQFSIQANKCSNCMMVIVKTLPNVKDPFSCILSPSAAKKIITTFQNILHQKSTAIYWNAALSFLSSFSFQSQDLLSCPTPEVRHVFLELKRVIIQL